MDHPTPTALCCTLLTGSTSLMQARQKNCWEGNKHTRPYPLDVCPTAPHNYVPNARTAKPSRQHPHATAAARNHTHLLRLQPTAPPTDPQSQQRKQAHASAQPASQPSEQSPTHTYPRPRPHTHTLLPTREPEPPYKPPRLLRAELVEGGAPNTAMCAPTAIFSTGSSSNMVLTR